MHGMLSASRVSIKLTAFMFHIYIANTFSLSCSCVYESRGDIKWADICQTWASHDDLKDIFTTAGQVYGKQTSNIPHKQHRVFLDRTYVWNMEDALKVLNCITDLKRKLLQL